MYANPAPLAPLCVDHLGDLMVFFFGRHVLLSFNRLSPMAGQTSALDTAGGQLFEPRRLNRAVLETEFDRSAAGIRHLVFFRNIFFSAE